MYIYRIEQGVIIRWAYDLRSPSHHLWCGWAVHIQL